MDNLKPFRVVVREEVKGEVSHAFNSLRSEIKLFRMEIQSSLNDLENRIKDLDISITNMSQKGESNNA